MSAPGRGPNLGIIGVPGSGKTRWALDALNGLHAEFTGARSRVIFVDPAGTVNAFPHWTRSPTAVRQVAHSTGPFAVSVRLEQYPRARRAELVEECAALAVELRRVTLVVDEFGMTVDPKNLPEKLEYCIFGGRHVGVSVWPVSQRAVHFPPDLRQCLDAMVVLAQSEANDVETMNRWSARAADNAEPGDNRRIGEVARDLPDRAYIVLRRGRWRVYDADGG